MATESKQAGKVAKTTTGGRSSNTDKTGNKPAVNQGISNAGATGNRNDRSDKNPAASDNGKKSATVGKSKSDVKK